MAEYPLPPWLHGVSPEAIGTLYSGGMRLGASIAQEQAQEAFTAQQAAQQMAYHQQQLQQEKELAIMRADAQAKQQAQANAMAQQRIEMERAYHDQRIGIEQQKAAEAQQALTAKAQLAARQFDAQQRAARRISAGEDPAKVWLEEGPAAGQIGSTMGAAAMRTRAEAKQYGGIKVEDLGGGYRAAYRTGSPGMHVMAPEKGHDLTPAALASLAKAIPELELSAQTSKSKDSLSKKLLDKIVPMLESQTKAKAAPGGREVRRNPKTGKLELVKPEETATATDAPVLTGGDDGEEDEE